MGGRCLFAVHLIPVWIWIGNVVTAGTRWKNTEYAVTDKRIIIRSGFLSYEYQNIYYKEIADIHLHFGIIDRILHVGGYYDLRDVAWHRKLACT